MTEVGPLKTYASVDLELTGFDPATEEIIEIGITCFTVEQGTLQRGETFQSLVRPQNAHVRQRITGLTGISAAAVEAAPLWSDIEPTVRRLLEGVVLVGHGVDMDRRFLEAVGIARFAGLIDTLELSQIFLPTYHSYNLESLGQLFGVTHAGVHRALGDAEATIGVLSGCMQIFASLPLAVQQQVLSIAQQDARAWPVLFSAARLQPVVPVVRPTVPQRAPHVDTAALPTGTALAVGGLGVYPPGGLCFNGRIPAWLVAVADREQAFQYAQQYPEAEVYVGAFEYPSVRSIESLLDDASTLSQKERIALQKVLVWRALFSTFGLLSEINWSIIGTDAKRLFTTGFAARVSSGLVVADFRSIGDVAERRPLWVYTLEDLHDWLAAKSGYTLSWQSILASLRQVYNPETQSGQVEYALPVERLIADCDTYFASALLLLRRSIYRASGVAGRDELDGYVWRRLAEGAFGLAEKMEALASRTENTFLQKQVTLLKRYFSQHATQAEVVWVEFSDRTFSYHTKPVRFTDVHQQFIAKGSMVVYQTNITQEQELLFIRSRIGIPAVAQVKLVRPVPLQVAVELCRAPQVHQKLNELLSETTGATLVLFSSSEELRAYYDTAYATLLERVPVLAIGIHGGAQKILRNFNRSARSVVLGHVSSLHGYTGESARFARVIYVSSSETLVSPHPYAVAVAKSLDMPLEALQDMQERIAFVRALASIAIESVETLTVLMPQTTSEARAQLLLQFMQHELSTEQA